MKNNDKSEPIIVPVEKKAGEKIHKVVKNKKALDLKNIQANILKPHGRNHVWCLFIVFDFSLKGDKNQKIKKWISKFAASLTTAQDQVTWSNQRKEERNSSEYLGAPTDKGLVQSFYLSAKGYNMLDDGKSSLTFPDDASFWEGMKLADWKHDLYSPKNIDLQGAYKNEIHALIVLADDKIETLNEKQNEINAQLANAGVGRILHTEIGAMIKINKKAREHFGYQDGISNPTLLNNKNVPILKNCMDHILDDTMGSYLVFMKLEQNVKLFNNKIVSLAKHLKIDPQYAGAQVIGRTKEGIPLTVLDHKGSNIHSMSNIHSNKSKCPFHAHALKASNTGTKIVRRGVPYGYRKEGLKDEPESGVGLLFMSFQKSIKQFKDIQEQFNANEQPSANSGIDPIMGQALPVNTEKSKHKWIRETRDARLDFFDDKKLPEEAKGKVVTVKGGEYFYSPSISFLTGLNQAQKNNFGLSENPIVVAGPSPTGNNAKHSAGVRKLLTKLYKVTGRVKPSEDTSLL